MSDSFLTFKNYLRIMGEDANMDAEKIRGDIAMLDASMATKNKPLMDKKMQLTKLLAIKEKQAQAEMKKQPGATDTGEVQQTATPGSSGGGTPGTQDQR